MTAQIIGTLILGAILAGILVFGIAFRPLERGPKERDPLYFARKMKHPSELSTRGLKLMFCANPRGIVHETIKRFDQKQKKEK